VSVTGLRYSGYENKTKYEPANPHAVRRWRWPFRRRGSRREPAVAQLFSLGHIRVMKMLIMLILSCASLFGADITTTTNNVGDITTKISERTAADGKPTVRIETLYRGKAKVFQIVSHCNKQGTLAVVSRAYFVSGKLHMVESDDDGDGFFESVMVFDPTTGSFEMFTRQADGSVNPVSTQKLDAIKREKAMADESMEKLKPDMTDRELGDLLETNRLKIEAIKNEKKD
jgi:hypothetical protein